MYQFLCGLFTDHRTRLMTMIGSQMAWTCRRCGKVWTL